MPTNPFNGLSNSYIVYDGVALPESAVADYGWIYRPSTKTVLLNKDGIDSKGISYFDY